jgi:SAM-dependent methyltransferase
MMLLDLQAAGYDIIGVDASPRSLDYCRRRGVKAVQGSLPAGLPLPADSVDAVLLMDVLEHTEDDHASFRSAMEIVRPGGIVIVTVPANQFLWTRRDEFHGHKRRYAAQEFRDVLRAHPSGRIMMASYMNSFLFPLAIAERLFHRIFPPKKAATMKLPWHPINWALEAIHASESRLLSRGFPLPAGLSLVGVGQKREPRDRLVPDLRSPDSQD